MEFRTRIEIKNKVLTWSHHHVFMLLGSCFTDHIGERMQKAGFMSTRNPYGVLYNPFSILNALKNRTKEFCAWTQKTCEEEDFTQMLQMSNVLILTFGTSWVYALKKTGHIVANCKKQPDQLFNRRRLTVDEIVEAYSDFIEKTVRPSHQTIVFTVSPIRHKKDGLHQNQVSKAILLLSIEELCTRYPDCCHYFPAYEIMMDDLRDYRFYADDMLHPSAAAIQYIWEQFLQTYFNPQTIKYTEQFERLNKILVHRPSDSGQDAYQSLVTKTQKQIKQLKHAVYN